MSSPGGRAQRSFSVMNLLAPSFIIGFIHQKLRRDQMFAVFSGHSCSWEDALPSFFASMSSVERLENAEVSASSGLGGETPF